MVWNDVALLHMSPYWSEQPFQTANSATPSQPILLGSAIVPKQDTLFPQFGQFLAILCQFPGLLAGGIMTALTGCMNKAWLQTIPGLLLLGAMLTKLRDTFRFEIPVGYQDETGFHTGVKPAAPKESFPEFW